MDDTQAKGVLRHIGQRAEKKSIVAIITARGGSKGLPRKNIRILGGKPLIAHTIAAAVSCPLVDRAIVSTDDAEIKKVSAEQGADVIVRPSHLATDLVLSRDVVGHVLEELAARGQLPDYFVLLQPTSPFRTVVHLTECIEQFLASGKVSAISVTETEHHPLKSFLVDDSGTLTPLGDYKALESPRQLLPKAYRPNGAIYLMASRTFLEHKSLIVPPLMPYIMSREASIDIDDAVDLALAELLMSSMPDKQ